MSCYTRHLDEMLPADPSPADRRALDARVHDALGAGDADCPEIWAAVKVRRSDPAFVSLVSVLDGRALSPTKARHDGRVA